MQEERKNFEIGVLKHLINNKGFKNKLIFIQNEWLYSNSYFHG